MTNMSIDGMCLCVHGPPLVLSSGVYVLVMYVAHKDLRYIIVLQLGGRHLQILLLLLSCTTKDHSVFVADFKMKQ